MKEKFIKVSSWFFIIAGVLAFSSVSTYYEPGTAVFGTNVLAIVLTVVYACLVLNIKKERKQWESVIIQTASWVFIIIAILGFLSTGINYSDGSKNSTELVALALIAIYQTVYTSSVLDTLKSSNASSEKLKSAKRENSSSTQIPWKYLPLVLVALFVLWLPITLTRYNMRQAAQEIKSQETVRQIIIDSTTSNGNGLTATDGACIADVLIAHHGEAKLRQLNRSGTVGQIYTADVKAKLHAQCG